MQKISNAEAMAQADYRNVPFLARFITPTGQLTPRRRTKLQQKVHRHVCRQVCPAALELLSRHQKAEDLWQRDSLVLLRNDLLFDIEVQHGLHAFVNHTSERQVSIMW